MYKLVQVPRGKKAMSETQEDAEETQLTASGSVKIDQATQLLETVQSKCQGTRRAGVFFYDELASALIGVRARTDKRINATSLRWMNENLTSDLETMYLDELPGNEDDAVSILFLPNVNMRLAPVCLPALLITPLCWLTSPSPRTQRHNTYN